MDSTKSQKEEPSLEEWMAKIREKKLKPVVINEHKAKETLPDHSEKPKGPHNPNDIVKLRQGLRSVSTPKWPGANDVKAKINTTAIPQRAQLRSVSDRPLLESRRSNVSVTSDDSATKDDKKTRAAEAEKPVEIKNKSVEPVEDKPLGTEQSEDLNSHESKDADEDFPLDKESVTTNGVAEVRPDIDVDEPSASSGVVASKEAVELKLPMQNDDTFPLDVLTTNVPDGEVQEKQEAAGQPVTMSSGVFDTSADTVSLKLPEAENEGFPLDLKQKNPDVPEAAESGVGLSTGVIDPEADTAALELPSKEDLDSIKTGEQQTGSKKSSPDTHQDSSAKEIKEAPETHEKHNELELTKDKDMSENNHASATIKCSQCAVDLDMEELDRHKCTPAEVTEDF